MTVLLLNWDKKPPPAKIWDSREKSVDTETGINNETAKAEQWLLSENRFYGCILTYLR